MSVRLAVSRKGITTRSAKLGGWGKGGESLQVEIHVFLECGSVILLVHPVPCPTCDWNKLGFNPI